MQSFSVSKSFVTGIDKQGPDASCDGVCNSERDYVAQLLDDPATTGSVNFANIIAFGKTCRDELVLEHGQPNTMKSCDIPSSGLSQLCAHRARFRAGRGCSYPPFGEAVIEVRRHGAAFVTLLALTGQGHESSCVAAARTANSSSNVLAVLPGGKRGRLARHPRPDGPTQDSSERAKQPGYLQSGNSRIAAS